MRLRPVLTAALAAVAATCLLAATPSPADESGRLRVAPGESVTTTWYEALDALTLADEQRDGYVRTAFRHWVDADKDGCNTRQEVLIAESLEQPEAGARCTIAGGRWLSLYDNLEFTDPTRLDIDHLVPLAEAWDSGASTWTAAERQAYANDLGDPRSLVGVTDNVNQAKGDPDVAEWLPQYDRCRYLREYVAVKHRWRLTVDSAEKSAMKSLAATCTNSTITVTLAR